ncbi:FtsK/SpoIIIE domain-containing protein [Streptomyces aidingensis]|uniref:DNA segregation ATPase FtsK/SpoIIIE, S-DNA-T family n=1 Tax=Streptomyces aidingensis TaxID=910347 RepID=A0A1I1TAD6_9ACTN|nr:FtsK/SpoIIIE domain-containing protein [Streptomyces aidingensis]SFD55592.1 DNA segregation ATPase FtsK/SpoIIIE, S-DNA-T family [Streptomyces aidingensis]
MKLTVTAADARGRLTDHLLDLPEGATVGELAAALDTPRLFLDHRPLDAGTPLVASGVRDGAVLGLDGPAPARPAAARAWRPPDGDPVLLELRHVSGPGAGRVWRLGPGRYEAGTDRGCAVRLDPGTGQEEVTEAGAAGRLDRLPERGVWITVHTDGSASFLLPPDADPAACGLRSLTPPPPVDPDTGTPLTDEEPAGPQDGGPGGHSAEPPPPGPDGLPEPPPLLPPGEQPPPSDGSLPWPPYADLSLGDHLLRLVPPSEPDAAVKPAADGLTLDYSRPPRMAPHLDAEQLTLPGPPAPSGPRPFPFILMISPMVMGLAMIMLFRSFYFMILILLTPLMAVGNWVTGRRANRKRHEEAMRRFRLRRAALERDMRRATALEREQRGAAAPDPAAVLLAATGPGRHLWERRRHHPDYLSLRLGTVTRASLKRISDAAREQNHRQVHWRLADVPIGAELPELGVLGLVCPAAGTGTAADGRADTTGRAVARWAVAQAAALHSPRDLRIVILTEEDRAEDWAWARWLRHLRPYRPAPGGTPLLSLGTDAESTARRVSELYADIQARAAAAPSGPGRGGAPSGPDVLVVLDGAYRLRDVPGLVGILSQGPAVRVFSLCLEEREERLPEECRAVITAAGDRLSVRTSGAPTVSGIRADQVTPQWCEELARGLAPLRDVTVDADAGLPSRVRLLPLIGQEPPDPEALVMAWRRRPASTAFAVGAGFEGTVHLDLVADGPHGLIGGTTGSGKSELLQTVIASLAAVNRPDELTFVLVDYKGGSAFRECAELPHTLGMITDLDGHLVQRALASLDAELKRREQVLADAGVKDHREYRAKRARDPQLPPLPRLLLVIDEFATLVREQVEFVPGLIGLAQRGRSLGLHLLLATQRPAGSVSNEIRANTNLRIALRVTDRTESQDIINAPDAAAISPRTPGRALVRRGSGAPMPFQTAWAGAERQGGGPASGAAGDGRPREVRRAELSWARLGRPPVLSAARTGPAPDAAPDGAAVTAGGAGDPGTPADPPTDLSELVAAIRAAAEALPDFTPQPRPWLPPLPTGIPVAEPAKDPLPGTLRLPPVPYVMFDLPGSQKQVLGHLDFAAFGHLYVLGAPRSGRTQTLRTIAGSAALHLCSDQLHLYGIDAAGGGLTALGELPHCGAVVSRHDSERLGRLVQFLLDELTRRQGLLARHGAGSLTELRARLPREERPAHLLVLIDGWDALSAQLERADGGRTLEELLRLLREGAAAGVHVVATSEKSLLGGRAAQHNDRRVMLRQADRMDYGLIGVNRRVVPEHVPPGRGWFAPGGAEGQILTLPLSALAKGDDQADALAAIGRRAGARDGAVPPGQRPVPVAELPAAVGFTEAAGLIPDTDRRPLWALLGLGGNDAGPVGFDFAESGTFVVYGPPRSGRSTALAAMSVSLLMGGTSLVVVTPRDSPLRRLAAHGLARVLDGPDLEPGTLNEALEQLAGRPAVVVVDDADLLANGKADQALRKVGSAGRERSLGLLLAGPADGLPSMGWVGVARRARRGMLMAARGLGDGELIGTRLTPDHLRPAAAPGRAWTTDRSGSPMAVQVPLTVLEE